MKRAYCVLCKQEIHFYQDNSPETVDCPRCGATDLIVREEEEDCPVCHGAGATTDHHDPCSECGGSGKVG